MGQSCIIGVADSDYATVKIPVLMAKTVDAYLETDHAQRNGFTSRSDLVMQLLRKFFEEYEAQYGRFAVRDEPKRPKTR